VVETVAYKPGVLIADDMHIEFMGDRLDLLGRAGQGDDRQIEARQVLRKNLGRIPFGINGDKDRLHGIGRVLQLMDNC
jgi:hypothetical protein